MMRAAIALGLLALIAGGPAAAQDLMFKATLRGDQAPTVTGSKATGLAKIRVDVAAQTVDLSLDVAGLTTDDLWNQLKTAPIGPIHLHLYGTHNHADPNAQVTLVFPAPYGAAYSATPAGFKVVMVRFPYAQAAAILKSNVPFNDFVSSLESGAVVVNIHTNAQPDGEISGDVVPVKS